MPADARRVRARRRGSLRFGVGADMPDGTRPHPAGGAIAVTVVSEVGSFARFPSAQKFTKTDVAKFENTWSQKPHIVSRGAQKSFFEFMDGLNADGEEPEAGCR